jgi:hypothetical protein
MAEIKGRSHHLTLFHRSMARTYGEMDRDRSFLFPRSRLRDRRADGRTPLLADRRPLSLVAVFDPPLSGLGLERRFLLGLSSSAAAATDVLAAAAKSCFVQCCWSRKFWYGFGSGDPYIWLMDPDPDADPAIFVSALQDANKFFLLITFWRYIYIIFQR